MVFDPEYWDSKLPRWVDELFRTTWRRITILHSHRSEEISRKNGADIALKKESTQSSETSLDLLVKDCILCFCGILKSLIFCKRILSQFDLVKTFTPGFCKISYILCRYHMCIISLTNGRLFWGVTPCNQTVRSPKRRDIH